MRTHAKRGRGRAAASHDVQSELWTRALSRNLHDSRAGAHAGLRLKLLEFCGRTDDVADPWYTGDFETTYRDVFDGCAGLLENLLERNA